MSIYLLFPGILASKTKLGISFTNSFQRIGREPFKPTESLNSVNNKLHVSFYSYHLVQEIPLTTMPEYQLIDQSNTDASIILSVIPTLGWNAVTDSDLDELVKQCEVLNSNGREVYLRFAPDMNVPWFVWGMSPVRFVSNWNKLAAGLKNSNATNTFMIWSPFEGNSYPFGEFQFSPVNGTDEFAQLDTDQNNELDINDDSYSPFYPGDWSVDWVGLSVFWKSIDIPAKNNSLAPEGYVSSIITGVKGRKNFYNEYALQRNKSMMLETGIYYYYNLNGGKTPLPGRSELEMKQKWWSQFIGNSTFSKEFPMINMICFSESIIIGEGKEKDLFFDSRLSYDPKIYTKFGDLIHSHVDDYEWAKAANITSWNPERNTVMKDLPSSFPMGILLSLIPVGFFGLLVYFVVIQIRNRSDPIRNEAEEIIAVILKDSVDDRSTVCSTKSFDSQRTNSDSAVEYVDGRDQFENHLFSVTPNR